MNCTSSLTVVGEHSHSSAEDSYDRDTKAASAFTTRTGSALGRVALISRQRLIIISFDMSKELQINDYLFQGL